VVKLNAVDVEEYLKRFGKQGTMVLSTLGKLQPFVACMESEIGKEILANIIQRYEILMEKVVDMAATDAERVELKVTKQMILAFANQIQAYNARVERVAGVKKPAVR
jgi:hypothetical protein